MNNGRTSTNLKYHLSVLQSQAGLRPELVQSAILKKKKQKELRKKRQQDEPDNNDGGNNDGALAAIAELKLEQYQRKTHHWKRTYQKAVKTARIFVVQRVIKTIKTAKQKTESTNELLERLEAELAIAKAIPVDKVADLCFSAIEAAAQQQHPKTPFDLATIDMSSIANDTNAHVLQRLVQNKALGQQTLDLFGKLAEEWIKTQDIGEPDEDESIVADTTKTTKKKKNPKQQQKSSNNSNQKRGKTEAVEKDDENEEDDVDDIDPDGMFVGSLAAAAATSSKPTTPKAVGDQKQRKNRPGQRARQQKHLLLSGMKATQVRRIVSTPGAGKASLRSAPPLRSGPPRGRPATKTGDQTSMKPDLHPSWVARIEQKKKQEAAAAASTSKRQKIVFDD